MNSEAVIKGEKDGFTITYPKWKRLFIWLTPVNNNINVLLRDAQKLTYEHVIKPMTYWNLFKSPKKYTVCLSGGWECS
jgi:hypothetical protein